MKCWLKRAAVILTLSASVLASYSGCSPSSRTDFAFDKSYRQVSPFYEGYAIVTDETGEKLIDTEGKVILEGDFDRILGVSEGLIGVEQAGKSGFLNLDGSIAIPLQYYSATLFSDNFARVSLRHGYGTQFNYVDKSGNELFDFTEGTNRCLLQTASNESITVEISNTTDFENGVAAIANEHQKWAMINNSSVLITDFIFQEIQPFSNMLAKCRNDEGRIFYIDTQGNTIFSIDADDSFSCHSDRIRFLRGTLYGFIDDSGNTISDALYSAATDFGEDTPYAIVSDSDTAYVMNSKGQTVEISAKLSEFYTFSDGVAAVRLPDESYAYVNSQGKISKQRFDFADTCANGFCPVKQGNQAGYFEKSLLVFE